MNGNETFFKENIHINNNVLEVAYDNDVQNLVSILSTCIFPNENIKYPLTYDQLDIDKPHSSNIGYSYAKRLLYYSTKMYRNFSDRNWISIIPCNIFGKNDQFNLENSHIIPALIRKAWEAREYNKEFEVWGDGAPLRQFIFVDDLSKTILWSIDNWKKEQPFMAVNPNEYSIKDVVNIIADKFNVLDKIVWNKNKPNGQYKKTASTDINDFKFTSLEEGLNITIDWYINNLDKIRK